MVSLSIIQCLNTTVEKAPTFVHVVEKNWNVLTCCMLVLVWLSFEMLQDTTFPTKATTTGARVAQAFLSTYDDEGILEVMGLLVS